MLKMAVFGAMRRASATTAATESPGAPISPRTANVRSDHSIAIPPETPVNPAARRSRWSRYANMETRQKVNPNLLESDHGNRIDSCCAECRSQAPGNGRRSGERGRDGIRHPVRRTHPDEQRLQPSTRDVREHAARAHAH